MDSTTDLNTRMSDLNMDSPQPSIYQTDHGIIRLRKIIDSACTKAFFILMCWLLPNWDRSKQEFVDFLEEWRKIDKRESRNAVNPDQKTAMAKDPRGDTWDMTLLFALILWGNEFLTKRGDPVWKTQDVFPSSLESLITTVKNERNSLMHPHEPISDKDFFKKTETVRSYLEEMISFAGCVCKRDENEVKEVIIDLHNTINRCRDDCLDPMDFDEYRQNPIFHHQRDLVREKGKSILIKCHIKFTTLPPVSYLVKAKFPVNDVYTKMNLKKGEGDSDDETTDIEMEALLEGEKQSITNSVILVEGDAGIGKSTLTRKIMNDWTKGIPDIKFLTDFDIVLHAECRERVASMKGLVEYLMPEVSRCFKGDDIIYVLGDLRTLIIIDGLDEMNDKSTKLVKEILGLKAKYVNFMVLITTRPESVYKYYILVRHTLSETKHIRLLGIPPERRNEFIRKYFDSLPRQNSHELDIDSLLKYLKMTEYCFGNMWESPYNLTLLVILWTMKPQVINEDEIKSISGLYREMLLVYLEKLDERLCYNSDAQSQSALKRKIRLFLHCLRQEALTALESNNVTLDQAAYERLETRCTELEVPVEEMVGAFLKQTKTFSGTKFSFPHKGFQDFLSAQFIFFQISDSEVIVDTTAMMLEIEKILAHNAVPVTTSHDIVQCIRAKLKKEAKSSGTHAQEQVIRHILEKTEDATSFDITKYQHLLICLISLFYHENNNIKDDVKREALNLLQESGVRTRREWLNVLNVTKCDKFVATYIGAQTEILRDKIMITDSSLFAYISILQALEHPAEESGNVEVSIDIKDDSPCINKLVEEVNRMKLNVTKLYLQHDFRNPANVIVSTDVINQLFERARLENYRGGFTSGMKLPHFKLLRVSVATQEAFNKLYGYLELSNPADLGLCIPPTISSSFLRPIQCHSLELSLPDVTSEVMKEAVVKAQALQPKEGMFTRIFYPRCNLTMENIVDLLDNMYQANVKVSCAIYFPSKIKPSIPGNIMRLENIVKDKLGCSIGIEWGKYFIDEW